LPFPSVFKNCSDVPAELLCNLTARSVNFVDDRVAFNMFLSHHAPSLPACK